MANGDKTHPEETLITLIRHTMNTLIARIKADQIAGRPYDEEIVERFYKKLEADIIRAGYIHSPDIAAKYEELLSFVTHI